jgi:hypothetical protein
VFSNNHEVVGSDGRVYDLGSWRGSGATIADVLNADFGSSLDRRLDYLDFYCGFLLARPFCEGDDDLSEPLRPVYRHLFERLQAHGCTWRYAPPGSDRLLPADGGRPAESLPVTARAYRDVYGHAPHSLDSDQER